MQPEYLNTVTVRKMNHIHITRCEITKYRTTAFRCHTKYIGKINPDHTVLYYYVLNRFWFSFSSGTGYPLRRNRIIICPKKTIPNRHVTGIARIYTVIITYTGTCQTNTIYQNPVTILRYNSPIIRTFYDNIPHYQIIAVLSIYHIVSGAGIMFPIGTI